MVTVRERDDCLGQTQAVKVEQLMGLGPMQYEAHASDNPRRWEEQDQRQVHCDLCHHYNGANYHGTAELTLEGKER